MSNRNALTHILVVDDEEIVRESLLAWLEKDGYTVAVAPDGPSALEKVRERTWQILLVDLKMPGMDGLAVLAEVHRLRPETSVVLMTAYATVDTAVMAMKLGAYDYLVKPFDPDEMSLMVHRIVEQQSLSRENALLRRAVRNEHRFHELVSESPRMRSVFELARAAAHSVSTVLVLGESGTGKELLARALHAESPRSHGAFVAVSCAALTETLLESELFGYEKGSFTGAAGRRRGKLELAAGGTLFLDEIGDVSPKLQMDLLRVLEDRRFFRVGGNESIALDARVIAATNRDLKAAVADGSFREDLYYRLNVVPIVLPPLRDRREDIPLLVSHLLERLAAETGRHVEGVTAEAMERLCAHPWPGNVRELRNILERALVVASGHILTPRDLGLDGGAGTAPEQVVEEGTPASLEQVEREHVAHVLERTGGNVSRAARLLGIDRVTLYNKMKRYGIHRDVHREEA
jgi:DNA-binding NtrC family response regulator